MRLLVVLAFFLIGAGARADSARYLSVTFDDGWDVPAAAWELFDAAGIVGTAYLNSKPLNEGWPAYMTWPEVIALHKRGWELGSHTVSHANLVGMWSEPLIEELVISRLDILKYTGVDPRSFAVPYGAYDARVSWYMERYYDSVVRAWGDYGLNRWTDPMGINRLAVNDKMAPGWVCNRIGETPAGGWFVLLFHQIGLAGSDYSYSLGNLRKVVECISDEVEATGLIVDTVSGVLERQRRAWLAENEAYPPGVGP